MREIRQGTSVDLPIGPFLDSTGAALTALTITQPDIRLKKNGGAWAQKNAAQTLTHEENGHYEVTLDATDTGTLGALRLVVAEAGSLQVVEDFMVLAQDVWDAKYGTKHLRVHPAKFSIVSGTITAYEKDGTTTQFSATVGGTAGADPATSLSA